MRGRVAASVAVMLGVALGGFGLTGCTASGGSSGGDSSALPPVIVDLGDVDGRAVDIADPAVVEFVPGRDDGSAQFNPGLTAKSVGTTEVTLDNSESGDSVTFTVDVVREALRRLQAKGIDTSNAVMVGDRGYDTLGAGANGVPTILVEWGYGSPAEAADTIAVVHSTDQLRNLLLG